MNILPKELSREERLELAIKLIQFELGTMPPIPNFGIPFGITQSLKVAREALQDE